MELSLKATGALPRRSVSSNRLESECFVGPIQKITCSRKANSPQPGASGRVDDFTQLLARQAVRRKDEARELDRGFREALHDPRQICGAAENLDAIDAPIAACPIVVNDGDDLVRTRGLGLQRVQENICLRAGAISEEPNRWGAREILEREPQAAFDEASIKHPHAAQRGDHDEPGDQWNRAGNCD